MGGGEGGQEGGEMGRGGCNGEGETGRGNLEGGNGEGGKMKQVGIWRGRRRGKRRGDFTDGYDGMPGWTQAVGLINICKQIKCLGRQSLSRSLIATSTWNAWVE